MTNFQDDNCFVDVKIRSNHCGSNADNFIVTLAHNVTSNVYNWTYKEGEFVIVSFKDQNDRLFAVLGVVTDKVTQDAKTYWPDWGYNSNVNHVVIKTDVIEIPNNLWAVRQTGIPCEYRQEIVKYLLLNG